MIDGQFIGLISIALALFFGLFFGLRGLRIDITGKLDTIAAEVREVRSTTNRIWDVIIRRLGTTGTVEGSLKNLGKVKISAEPGASKTTYTVDVEKPVLKQDFINKLSAEPAFQQKVVEAFQARQGLMDITMYAPNRLKIDLPSTDSKTCTQFMSFFMKWLDSTYFESLKEIDEFEKSILT